MKNIALLLLIASSFSVSASEYKISIPTDSKADYTVISKGESEGLKTITTKRVGSSGESYSERAYDCAAMTVKYVGSGETLEQMKSSPADRSMSPITPESIADYVGREACGK